MSGDDVPAARDKPVALGSAAAQAWRVDAASVDMVRTPRPPQPVVVPAEPQQVRFDLACSALVVIDMQNDFCHPDGWLASIGVDVTPARAAIAPLRTLLPAWRRAGAPVLWVNWGNRPDLLNLSPSLLHVYKPAGRGVGLGDLLPGRDARVLQAGSWSAQVVDELAPATSDVRVDKYRMSGFPDTALDSILRNLGVRTLLFAGVNADQCVMCTLQDANFLGYDCLLVREATATTSPAFCMEATLYNVRQCFGFVVGLDDLVRVLPP